MKKNIVIIVSMVICLMTLVPKPVLAAQYDNAENARSVGGISFYDDELTEVPPQEENKVKGFLPKTGETEQKFITLLGCVVLSLVVMIINIKNKQIRGDK